MKHANRPSESHRRLVRTKSGEMVKNDAYDAKAEAEYNKAQQVSEDQVRTDTMESVKESVVDKDNEYSGQRGRTVAPRAPIHDSEELDETRDDLDPVEQFTPDDKPEDESSDNKPEKKNDESGSDKNYQPDDKKSDDKKSDNSGSEKNEESSNNKSEYKGSAEDDDDDPELDDIPDYDTDDDYEENSDDGDGEEEDDSPFGIDRGMLGAGLASGAGMGFMNGRQNRKMRKAEKKRTLMGFGNEEAGATGNMMPNSINSLIDKWLNPWK